MKSRKGRAPKRPIEPIRDVGSPVSTGGGGSFFEQQVDATFLALLLVQGFAPCIDGCLVEEVHFQTGHKGWQTDDLLVVGRNQLGKTRRLAAQVKLKFKVSASDDDCRQTITNMWLDYTNLSVFDRVFDKFAIIVSHASEVLLTHFSMLLETARASLSVQDFFTRISQPKILSKKVYGYYQEIRKIVEESIGSPPSDDDYWAFLKSIFLLPLDLASSTGQSEALMKSLLANSISSSDKLQAAESSWAELVALVSKSMPFAGSFVYDGLPGKLRQKHSLLGNKGSEGITLLKEHSMVVLRAIVSTIGPNIHISRTSLVNQLTDSLNENQVVVVTGPAGSGKSAIAKTCAEHISENHPLFAFRSEEFAVAHIDETLHHSQVHVNSSELMALLGSHPRKFFLVESVERILEKSIRGAFVDLLQLIHADGHCRLILTCRDYSVELIRSAFLDQANLRYEVIQIPLLWDDELNQVIDLVPALKRPSSSVALRSLFRNPYILDKACRMTWPTEGNLPQDESEFRAKVWGDIIRANHTKVNDLPERRAKSFIQIALRRAQSLSPFASCDDLDREALQKLRHENLIEFSQLSESLAAPSHDVLEDWALLHWLEEEFVRVNGDYSAFLANVGTHPALRRSYRKWLSEMLSSNPQEVDGYIFKVVAAKNVTQQSRDDTLVSILLSPRATAFLQRNEQLLFGDNATLLKRIIHLLRVACKTMPTWLAGVREIPPFYSVPYGDAWAAVLTTVSSRLSVFTERDAFLILGLLEDWSASVAWWSQYPAGSKEAATIAFGFIEKLKHWSHHDTHERFLKVIVKIPKAAPDSFISLIDQACVIGDRNDIGRQLSEILLEGMESYAVCRDFPDFIIALAESRWKPHPRDEDSRGYYHSPSYEIENTFGLNDHLQFSFYPQSALHGPFYFLLREHPEKGIEYVIGLLNHCVGVYASPKTPRRYIELPFLVNIELPNGIKRDQWCSDRLWSLYRGSSVAPNLLHCCLMALENHLLEMCKREDPGVESVLCKLLEKSNNVALTAVVASIAMAHPLMAGEAALSVLTERSFFDLDRVRTIRDYNPVTEIGSGMSRGVEEMYYRERKDSNKLEHRRSNLESLALHLQLSKQRDRVWKILDRFRSELPSPRNQSQNDKLWRLALHRMDIRQYTARASGEEDKVLLELKPPDSDVQEVISAHEPEQSAQTMYVTLSNWGVAVFQRRGEVQSDSLQPWKEKLQQAKEAYKRLAKISDPIKKKMAAIGPAYVSAVWVRDRWEELTDKDREWCIEVITESVMEESDCDDELVRVSRNFLDASRPCAFVLPILLGKVERKRDRDRLIKVLACAITHASEEVVEYTVHGMGTSLWSSNKELVLVCIGAIVNGAAFAEELDERERAKPYEMRSDYATQKRKASQKVKESIENGIALDIPSLLSFHFRGWSGNKALKYLLPIFANCPDRTLLTGFIKRIIQLILGWWDEDRKSRHEGGSNNYELERDCKKFICAKLLGYPKDEAIALFEPFANVVPEHPKELGSLLESLIVEEDERGSGELFWSLWQKTADTFSGSPKSVQIDDRHSWGIEILNALFLAVDWKEGVRAWKKLEGNAFRIDNLFVKLTPSEPVLNAYSRYLFHIGESALPRAFVYLSEKLSAGDARNLLSRNVIFYLESLLMRFVYSKPIFLKKDLEIRAAVLRILDELVESGSSAAYRMRDDFVTPVSA